MTVKIIEMNEIKLSKSYKQKKGTRIIFEAPIEVVSNANFQSNARVGAFSYIVSGRFRGLKILGRYCSISNDVKIGEKSHPISWLSTSSIQFNPERFGWHDDDLKKLTEPFVEIAKRESKPSVIIGHDVWVGAGAHILRGVEIGHGAVIGSGAVVTKNVLPYEIVGGVPARRIRFRFPDDIISRLLTVAWWQYHPLDLRGVDFTDIRVALDQIEKLQLEGKISPWEGDWFELKDGQVTSLDET